MARLAPGSRGGAIEKMSQLELLRLAGGAVRAHRLRSALTMLGISIGIASVILLTSIGEGTRRYVMAELLQFGTDVIFIRPGRITTTGPPDFLSTVRKLSVEDAEALRRVAGVLRCVPLLVGNARVEARGRGRSVFVIGATADAPQAWKVSVGLGRFLPASDPRRGGPITVLGPRTKQELFGDANALGEHVRIGGQRFLVVGVMAPKGTLLGLDIDDRAYIPVATAQQLFNLEELTEIHVQFATSAGVTSVSDGIRKALMARHRGEEDFTLISQTDMLAVFDRVLGIVSVGVTAIGGISLVVGAIGILTMMWISVNERTAEIGVARALGATPDQVLRLFLLEASLLSLTGGALGVAAGMGLARGLQLALPGLPVHTRPGFVAASIAMSLLVGLLSGVLPARRAAALDPVEALRAE
jgi:putative ABC transport system permease protein